MVQTIFKVQDERRKKGEKIDIYNEDEIVEEYCLFSVGGTDTSSRLVTMIVYYLSLHPECMQKVRKEIAHHVQSDKDLQNYDVLKKLTYIDCVTN